MLLACTIAAGAGARLHDAAHTSGRRAADGLGRTDPNGGLFPDSSIVDFSYLLEPPAGQHGFLGVDKDGHFAWENGQRARFWGVNISNKSVWIGKDEIDRVVDVLARAGVNMVRFEALDSYGGLLDRPDSSTTQTIDSGKIRDLDYWTSRLRERGIYYYLDLLDFREFKRGDDVPAYDQIGRAAKPYAIFDRRLIDLQQKYARQLLGHKNAYTGLRYADDPALALVEICNEHGLFFKADKLDTLVEPYATEFRRQWNEWLQQRYGSRDALHAAWGRVGDSDVLQDSEDPAANTVALPNFAPLDVQQAVAPDTNAPTAVDVRRADPRLRDGVRFLYEKQRAYFREMKAALHDIGVRVPVTGVVSNEFIADVASAAAECDFTSENYYYDHPTFAGKEWEGTFFYNDTDPIRNSTVYQLAPWVSALRWDRKPVVVREWANVWPNRYRAVGIPEMVAYASLQDFDAVLLFGYQVVRDPERLADFDHQCDPTVWGLFGMGAQAFLRGDVRPSPWSATLQYTPDTLFRWPNMVNNLHRLSWFVRLNSTVQGSGDPASAGATAGTTPPRERQAAGAKRQAAGASWRSGQPRPGAPYSALGARNSELGTRHSELRTRYYRRGPRVFASRGKVAAKRAAIRKTVLKVVHAGRVRSMSRALNVPAGDPNALAGVLEQYRILGAAVDPRMLETGVLPATNGEIVRNTATGLMKFATPRSVAICGELPLNQPVTAGDWTLVSPSGIGAFMAVSLDGKPLAQSRRYVVKMVTRAENTDQDLELADPGSPGRYHLKAWGRAPVLTFGRASETGRQLVVRHGDRTLLTLAMEDGTWEMLVQDGRATLTCDTQGIHGALFGMDVLTGTQPVVAEIPAPPARSRQAEARPTRHGARPRSGRASSGRSS